MSEIRTLGPWLERFFLEHIITERNLAINTRDSYRDTFELLLPFVCSTLKKPDDRLLVRDITSSLVLQFLAHLEEDRGCSAQTRNQRLTAIRAFARFVGAAIRLMSLGAVTSGPFRRKSRRHSQSDI